MSKSIKKKLKEAGMYKEVTSIIKEIINNFDPLDPEDWYVLNGGTNVRASTIISEAKCLLDIIENKRDKDKKILSLANTFRTLSKYVDETCDMHVENYTICLSHRHGTFHNLTYVRAWLILRSITDHIWLNPDEIEKSGFKHWTIPDGWRKEDSDEPIK